jgi:RimJ/RimL family protein N-acetyltransferase
MSARVEVRMAAETAESGMLALRDGTIVPYRPITPADREALQRFHTRLSGASIYLRFFGARPFLSEALARYFTELDGRDRFALVALDPIDPTEIIGVVRFDREPGTDSAEYAAIVVDAWQGHGLGLGLTRRLIESARTRDIRSFYALVLPENLRMLNLLRDLGLPERIRFEEGVERIDVDLTLTPEPA